MTAMVGRIALILTALGGAYVVALWFVLAVWTFRDIEARSRSVVTQVFSTLMVVLFFVPGVLLYLILRPKETLDEAFQRSLEEEYLLQDLEELPLCPSCHRYVDDDFVLCPNCHAQLREPCVGCSRLVDLRWALCPYCGSVQDGRVDVGERVETPAARWTAPALRRRRAVEERVQTADELVATAGSVARRVSPLTGQADAEEDETVAAGRAARIAAVGTVVRPFGRFGGHQEATTGQAADVILGGSTKGDDRVALALNGNGRPLTKRARFTRATSNGRSPGEHGGTANGHGHVDENGAVEEFAPLEPLQVAEPDRAQQDEGRKSELVDAGSPRT